VAFEAVRAALFTDAGTCRGIEEGEWAVPSRRSVPTRLTAARQVAKDPVQNRSLILRVFLPFVVGYYTAQVSENVYDSPTGNYLLIPQGARLIGQYDSQIAFGQSRVLLVWTRLLMPNGRSIVLERQPGTDAAGYSGLEDEVNNHWGVLFKAAVLSTLLSVGSEAGTSGNENNLVQAIRRGGSQSFNQVGQRVVSRNLDIQPTLTIRPGFPVRVIVNRDLMLAPYHQESAQ
jgi:type IV secretory pathway VirB10-like protein